MKRSLVVVFAVVLLGLWFLPCNEAVPVGELTTGVDTLLGSLSKDVKDIASSLLNTTSSLTTNLARVVSDVRYYVVEIVESVLHTVQSVVHWIISTIDSLFESIESISILPFLKSAFEGFSLNPINTVREWLPKSGTSVSQFFEEHIAELIRRFENTITTTGLPWLHSLLDRIESSYDVPLIVRGMIESFNAFYGTLQLFGYVGM